MKTATKRLPGARNSKISNIVARLHYVPTDSRYSAPAESLFGVPCSWFFMESGGELFASFLFNVSERAVVERALERCAAVASYRRVVYPFPS